MINLLPIYCQEHCPLKKKCCFGEVYVDSLGDVLIRERHKCAYPKKTGMKYVDTKIAKPIA